MNSEEPIWSVSAVNRAVKETLEGAFMPFWVGGEVGSLLVHRSGHVYFQLKDDKSQLRCCWFGGAQECRRLGVDNGMIVEVWGNLSVYEVRGEYHFTLRKLRPAGIGELQRRFEELKRKLDAEGLFDPARKKPIPQLPRRIGVVSSPSGAAIRDFLQIITRRFPKVQIRLYPALVQGAGAAESVASGVRFFNRVREVDVIVVTRGGGSMEDLWAFNEEVLARAVASSAIPVISAVGHEIDYTICDFVSDLRVPTPSAAAELVIGQRDEITARIDRAEKDLRSAALLRISDGKAKLNRLAASSFFHEPRRLIDSRIRYLDELDLRLTGALRLTSSEQHRKLETLETALNTLNPQRQLERGYAMVFDESGKQLIVSAKQEAGTLLKIRFADGELEAKSRK